MQHLPTPTTRPNTGSIQQYLERPPESLQAFRQDLEDAITEAENLDTSGSQKTDGCTEAREAYPWTET